MGDQDSLNSQFIQCDDGLGNVKFNLDRITFKKCHTILVYIII